jgi:competence ComEA-like helix-hairpin-helix protein
MGFKKPSKQRFYVIVVVAVAIAFISSCTERSRTATSKMETGGNTMNAIDINSATVSELQKIPHIGPKLAQKIVDFRDRHGPFRRSENLILIQGFSDTRYRQIKAFVKTE